MSSNSVSSNRFDIRNLIKRTKRFDFVVRMAELAFDGLRADFEDNVDLLANLRYHARFHTWVVTRNAEQIASALLRLGEITEAEYEVSILEALYHDTVQRYRFANQPVFLPTGKIEPLRRIRYTGDNEGASSARLIRDMIKIGQLGVLSDTELGLILQAHVATTPGYDPKVNGDPEAATVIQPMIIWGPKGSHPVVKTMALADLATSGMAPEEFPAEGDALFVEENKDVFDYCSSGTSGDTNFEELAIARANAWDASQRKFTRGRKLRKAIELDGMPKEVHDLFPDENFDRAGELAEAKFILRKAMPFRERMIAIGFPMA